MGWVDLSLLCFFFLASPPACPAPGLAATCKQQPKLYLKRKLKEDPCHVNGGSVA
jgi:hypothetical protein